MTQTSQSSERPLLSFAIPTYNRAKYLDQLLGVLLKQLQGESRVEVIVSDNASTDNTLAVVEDYRQRGLDIRYLRNESNCGSDLNFIQCFEQSRGKYVWICGDDDIIIEGGIAKILRLLEIENYGLVYVSAYGFRGDYIAEKTSDELGRFAEVFPDGLRFVRRAGIMITFLSAIIVNKDLYSTTAHQELSELIGTNLLQLGWICPVLASSSKMLIVWEKLVASKSGNTGDFGLCQTFGVNLERVLEMTLADRREIAVELRNRSMRDCLPRNILAIRKGTAGLLKLENCCQLLEPIYKRNWRYWIYIYPIIILPLAMAKIWFSIIIFASRVRRAVPMMLDLVFSRARFVKRPE
jgi:glycosyltransferase involved in cell wall biosynthesis